MLDDLDLLEEMLRIESLSGQEATLARFLRDEMAARGFDAQIDAAGNAVGRIGGDTPGPTIVLLGHMDTVPGAVPVRREGDRLFGRGAVDAKGPLATFIGAATGFTGPGRVVVVGAVEEEAATSKGARHAVTYLNPDYAIIGEPSNWDRVTLGYKGRLLTAYAVERRMAHTAGAESSAPERAFAFWQAVLSAVEELNGGRSSQIFERLQPSIRAMRSSSDGITEKAELDLGFRLPPDFDVSSFESQLLGLADGASLRFHGYEPAIRVEKNSPTARALLAGIRQQGGTPRFVVKTGTSDLNVVSRHWQASMVAYGPGDSAYDHTPNEQILITEYLQAIQVLRHALTVLAASTLPGSAREYPVQPADQ